MLSAGDTRALRHCLYSGARRVLTQREVLQNFFKSLWNIKDRAASPGAETAATAATAGDEVEDVECECEWGSANES
jgi:hypothetical protein